MANEKKRLDHDLEIARDIQRILLPPKRRPLTDFRSAALMCRPPGERRLFDYIRVDDANGLVWRLRTFRVKRSRIAYHGDLPQRVAGRGARNPFRPMFCEK
jgi:hypothetical protein